MVHKRNGKCILSCDNKSCFNESTETFKDIICPYHLSQVFGLKVEVFYFGNESTDFYVGPLLIVDESFSFEPNTVVFPERGFIDQYLTMADTKDEFFYSFKMNPRMASYLGNLQTNAFNFDSSEIRYQIEIIRNLFFIDKPVKNSAEDDSNSNSTGSTFIVDEINLAQGTEASNKDLLRAIKTRFQNLNTIIQTEDYNKIFEKITILDIGSDAQLPITAFTPFMNFMLFNCLTDEHKIPVIKDDAVGITCYLNLLYKQGVGFVTTQGLMNPMHLVIGGVTKGNNNYYQLKIRPINKRTVQNVNMHKKNLADNVRSSNILNPHLDFCWSRSKRF